MKILYVTAKLPYPLVNGGQIRVYHLSKALSRKHELTLLSFCQSFNKETLEAKKILEENIFKEIILVQHNSNKSKYFKIIKSLLSLKPYAFLRWYSLEMGKLIKQKLESGEFDCLMIEQIGLSIYAEKTTHFNVIKVLSEQNIESELYKKISNTEKGLSKLFYSIEARKVRRQEMKIESIMDYELVVSEEDRNKLHLNIPTEIIPNGVDTDYFYFTDRNLSDPNLIIFYGSMHYYPNIQAVKYFVKNILPSILIKNPKIKFYIAGNNPPKDIKILESENVVVTGFVEDIRELIERASIVVVPMLSGSGTRLKILEGMSMGKIIISSSLGCEGINVAHKKHLIIADTAKDFIKQIISVLNGEINCEEIVRDAREFVVESYNWGKIGDQINSVFDEIEQKVVNK
jgi:glycosyltransferase involved in cell wall biosynthesis